MWEIDAVYPYKCHGVNREPNYRRLNENCPVVARANQFHDVAGGFEAFLGILIPEARRYCILIRRKDWSINWSLGLRATKGNEWDIFAVECDKAKKVYCVHERIRR